MKTPTPMKRINHTMECLADKLVHFGQYQANSKKESSKLINRVYKGVSDSIAPADSTTTFHSESDSLSFLFYFQDECKPYVVTIIKGEKKQSVNISKKIPFDFFHSVLKDQVKLSSVLDAQDLFDYFSNNFFDQVAYHKPSSQLKDAMFAEENNIIDLDSELHAACSPFLEEFEKNKKPINQLRAEKEAQINAELEKTSEHKALEQAKVALKKAKKAYQIKQQEIKTKLDIEGVKQLQSRTLENLESKIEVAIINLGELSEYHAKTSTNGVKHALKLKVERKISELVAMYNENSPLIMQGCTIYYAISSASRKFPSMLSIKISRIKNIR